LRSHLTALQPLNFFISLRQAVALATLLVVVFGIALTSFLSQIQTTLAEEVGRLEIQLGTVKVRSADQPFFAEVFDGSVVHVGDTIRVEAGSEAVLAFLDKSQIQISPETELAITDFHLDVVDVGKSTVKVALVAGTLEATVAKELADAAFAIETPSGVVEAQKAQFAVVVDARGATTVTANESGVAFTPSLAGSEPTLIAEGQAGVSSGNAVQLSQAEEAAQILPIAELANLTDIWQIRTFDALIAAQGSSMSEARGILEMINTGLRMELKRLAVVDTPDDLLTALALAIEENYLEIPERAAALTDLALADQTLTVLNYYFVAPEQRVGVPEIAMVREARYQPSAELKKLFAVLSARNLAAKSSEVLVTELVRVVAQNYGRSLARADAENYTKKLLADMAAQPIYLPALREMRLTAPASVRYLLDRKIVELEAIFSGYVGN
jgi:hypothetical protein